MSTPLWWKLNNMNYVYKCFVLLWKCTAIFPAHLASLISYYYTVYETNYIFFPETCWLCSKNFFLLLIIFSVQCFLSATCYFCRENWQKALDVHIIGNWICNWKWLFWSTRQFLVYSDIFSAKIVCICVVNANFKQSQIFIKTINKQGL